jgi:hypothetical protein
MRWKALKVPDFSYEVLTIVGFLFSFWQTFYSFLFCLLSLADKVKHFIHRFLAKLGKWLNVEFFVGRFLPGGKKMMNKI